MVASLKINDNEKETSFYKIPIKCLTHPNGFEY